jgi:hypothetical protein
MMRPEGHYSMARKPKQRRMPAEPKVEAWAQTSTGKQVVDDPTIGLREEIQRMRIERVGFISEIAELKAAIVELRKERESLRDAIAKLPLPPPPEPPEKSAFSSALDDLVKITRESKP